jgi:hypothetical protein
VISLIARKAFERVVRVILLSEVFGGFEMGLQFCHCAK